MSWETIGKWLVTALKFYAIYFVAVIGVVGVALLVYVAVECRREKREGEK